MESQKILLALVIKNKGDWNKVYHALQAKEYDDLGEEFVEETFNKYEGKFITILDKEYPNNLKQTFKPPFVLFYEGNINTLTDSNVKFAIGDNRSVKDSDLQIANSMLSNLPQDTTLILGGEGRLSKSSSNNPKIIVLGYNPTAYDKTLKEEIIKNGGVIISENPTEEKSMEMFATRNRIMSSLCNKTLILTPIARTSGINMLISTTLTQGKDVFVIPQTPNEEDNSVNNELIYQGAIPIFSFSLSDVLA